MAEKEPEIVVNDRRKWTLTGDLREGAKLDDKPAEKPAEAPAETQQAAPKVTEFPKPASGEYAAPAASPASAEPENPTNFGDESFDDTAATAADADMQQGPTAEESEQVKRAFDATAERLETAVRANNLGAEHLPPMNFERLVQSIFMTAMMQLGAGTPQGEKARVDILGARNSIDMLTVLEAKTANNLDEEEKKLLAHALFELRMAFLEITQALARSAAAKVQGDGGPATGGAPGGPKLVV